MSDKKSTTGAQPESKASLERAQMQDERMQDVHAQLMREKNEPSEGFSPIPIFLLFIFAGLCFWGGVYMVQYSGGFRWDAYSPDFDADADQPAPVQLTLFERGERVYRSQCAACHQAAGTGAPGVWPPLDGSEWVTGHPEVLARILINGLSGPIEVKGSTYNGVMPAFGPNGLNLRPVEIAAVATYIRQEWSNEASEISEEQMGTYLAQYAGRGTSWKAAELREGLSPEPEATVAPETEETADGELEGADGEAEANAEEAEAANPDA